MSGAAQFTDGYGTVYMADGIHAFTTNYRGSDVILADGTNAGYFYDGYNTTKTGTGQYSGYAIEVSQGMSYFVGSVGI